jgi:hypothetical protein
MDAEQISALRKNEALVKLANGVEAAPISIQFKGELPQLSRLEQKRWLQEKFRALEEKLSPGQIQIDPKSISVSGQTIEGHAAITNLDRIQKAIPEQDFALRLSAMYQVVPARD